MVVMHSGVACRELVEKVEGREHVAYWDRWAKIWTIGIGHTGPEVVKGLVWTDQQIDENFAFDILEAEVIVNRHVQGPLSQSMFDACTSFVFNIGPGRKGVKDGFVTLKSGSPSTFLRQLNSRAYLAAANEIPKWNKAGGVVVNGLTIRRGLERTLFLRDPFPV